jgi:hypothetical protein
MPHAFAGRQVGGLAVMMPIAVVAVARVLLLGIFHPRGALGHSSRGADPEPEGADQQQAEERSQGSRGHASQEWARAGFYASRRATPSVYAVSSTIMTAHMPPPCATFTTWRWDARASTASSAGPEAKPIT